MLNLKLGAPLLIITFLIFGLTFYAAAQLVKDDDVTVEDSLVNLDVGTGPVNLTIVADSIRFDLDTIVAPAGVEVTVTMDHRDGGVPHNIAFYTDSSVSQKIFGSEIVDGPTTQVSTFTAPTAPGTYFFRCDVHPDTMTGAFIVR